MSHDNTTPSPASGELASLVESINYRVNNPSAWPVGFDEEASELFRLAASQLAAVAAERDALRIEIEAAKAFGGGYYGPDVIDAVKEIYRKQARLALSPGGSNGQG